MALPLLPGLSFDRNLGKEKFHLSQLFESRNGVHYLFGDNKPGIGGGPLPGGKMDAPRSDLPCGNTSKIPAFVAYDKQVLCFDAFFQESVNERREERFRIRQCKIYFYLEDDTVQILEPRIRNSGLPQGTLLRRHRVHKPAPNDDHFYTVHDFNVGAEVDIYGVRYRMVACDPFTQKFLRKLGISVGCPEPIPNDPYTSHRKVADGAMQPLRPYERIDTLKQFLDHDRHVLRFNCTWDDSKSLHGEIREFTLHYFLADDTMEIVEVVKPNSGRDGAKTFLKRSKVPKGTQPLPLPGTSCDRTVLNVMGHPQRGGRHMLDNLKIGKLAVNYYTDKDLTIGTTLDVFGRKFLLTDCDDFTKTFYRERYGVSSFDPVPGPTENCYGTIPKTVYPWNGWGSYEATLAACNTVLPEAPKKDLLKFLHYDKNGLESYELRFAARFLTDDPLEAKRRFVFSVFVADDTVQIFEPSNPESGASGGKFLARGRIIKPNQPRYVLEVPEYYVPTDFYVGATLSTHGRDFVIFDADDYALDYMEHHSDVFQRADVNRILLKLRGICQGKGENLMTFCQSLNPKDGSLLKFWQFQRLIEYIINELEYNGPAVSLVGHEIITLARRFKNNIAKVIDVNKLLSLVRNKLRSAHWYHTKGLMQTCLYEDYDNTGVLPALTFKQILKSFRIPLPKDLLDRLLHFYMTEKDCMISYANLIKAIDWRDATNQETTSALCNFSGNLEVDWLPLTLGEQLPTETKRGEARFELKDPVDFVRFPDFIEAVSSSP